MLLAAGTAGSDDDVLFESICAAPSDRQNGRALTTLVDCEQRTSDYLFDFAVPGISLYNVPNLHPALSDSSLNCQTSPLAPASAPRQVTAPEGHKPTVFNKLMAYAIEGIRAKGNDQNCLESHALFRTILWPQIDSEEEYLAHPLWNALRAVNEYVFERWHSKAQRIAATYLCSELLKVR